MFVRMCMYDRQDGSWTNALLCFAFPPGFHVCSRPFLYDGFAHVLRRLEAGATWRDRAAQASDAAAIPLKQPADRVPQRAAAVLHAKAPITLIDPL